MRATSFGHACWKIETAGGVVLTDPTLTDPFENGTVTACPSRTFLSSEVPHYDVLYISHRHLDHFHAPTLRRLPKDKPVLAPRDRLTLAALRELGFLDIRPLEGFEAHRFTTSEGTLEILPIPGVSDTFLEYGALVIEVAADGSRQTLFNQVDTPLRDEVIQRITDTVGRVDLHLAMYASQDFGWFSAQPERTAEVYTQNLHTALGVNAHVVVPAAAGFRFVDDFDYLNRLLFPVSVERFMQDLARLMPEAKVVSVDPGDVLEVGERGAVQVQASDEVALLEDDRYRLRYDPTAPIPPVRDLNPRGFPLDHLHGFANAVLEQGMMAYLTLALDMGEEVASQYREYGATYRVEVVFPDDEHSWTYRFGREGVSLHRDVEGVADAKWRLTGSGLLSLCEGLESCWALRPSSRKWSKLVVARNTEAGVRATEIQLPDLLGHFILNMRVRMRGEELAMLEYYGLLEA